MVIDIYAGSITMSWSYGADDAAPALAEVERYLPVIERHGYVAYDPQLERVFEPSRDRADAAEIHRDVRERASSRYPTRPAPGGSVCSAERGLCVSLQQAGEPEAVRLGRSGDFRIASESLAAWLRSITEDDPA